MSMIKIIAQKIGMDKSIAYSSGARIVQGFTGVASVFFITSFLTGVEQGFFFTFGSILALQVFFELGLTGIMTQYVAHEASHLQLDEKTRKFTGGQYYISRLSSLVHFCVTWYTVISIAVLFVLTIVGVVYFSRYGQDHDSVSWFSPWVLVCIGTAIKVFQSPFISILTGLGKVKEMSKIGFYQQIIIPLSTWIGLACDFKLYVAGIGYILSVIAWQIYVNRTKLDRIVINLWNNVIVERVDYVKEIFPYQWRIALSWVSGYFVFNLFNPVLFATDGPVIAGQVGMTLTAISAISQLSSSWLSTKIPLYSSLIARKEYTTLDSIFTKTMVQMVLVSLVLLLMLIGGLELLRIIGFKLSGTLLSDRFISGLPLILLVIPAFAGQFVGSWATYCRCHKKEPFLWQSVTMGILTMSSTLIFGKMYGVYGVTLGYCLLTVCVSLPWSYFIYKNKKREWHEEI